MKSATSLIPRLVACTRVAILILEGLDQRNTTTSRRRRRSNLRITRPNRSSIAPFLFTFKQLWATQTGEPQSP
uniref:Uncharacterized protein n=1 Tax=Brassica oleracea TaxID=3712 RepID=A0A3P6DUL7_BRAOL|nr:unnamed protein product [Brassica oleracea]